MSTILTSVTPMGGGASSKSSGGGSIDYLFGNGADGSVTLTSDTNYDTVKNFTDFTINSGVTLSRTSAGSPMIIKCTGTCTINGTINLDGKGWPAGMGYGTPVRTWTSGESSSAVGFSESQFSSIAGLTYKNRQPSGSFDENITYFLASIFDFGNIALMGGGGASVGGLYGYGCASGGSYRLSAEAAGGAGGGGLVIIAKKIILNGSISLKGASGATGQTGQGGTRRYGAAGGGGGGCAVLMGNEITGSGSITCSGGAGGSINGTTAASGGAGGFVKVLI